MIKSGIDQDAMVKMFSEATAKQGEVLRKAVGRSHAEGAAGARADDGQHQKVFKSVTEAASAGAAQKRLAACPTWRRCSTRPSPAWTPRCCRPSRRTARRCEQFVEQGVGVQEKQMKGALANIEKMEDMFFAAVTKAAQSAGAVQGPWAQVLDAMK